MAIDLLFKENRATVEDYRKVLNKVVPTVVILRITAYHALDIEFAGASYATGFIVDKSYDIILTNYHVIKPGPVVVEAMFANSKEISMYPIYRDPVPCRQNVFSPCLSENAQGQTIDDIPEGVLENCAQLVKGNSIKGNQVNNFDVVYTSWQNLIKAPSMEVGQVGFHNSKIVSTIRVENRINDIVNWLYMKKVERNPDLKCAFVVPMLKLS